jgi:bifunctional non-homologous end joining protein LigD
MTLVEYRKKRHFNKTAEPAGKKVISKQSQQLTFVIQKHAATRLHYDFRLELDGVLKSWAVPKGPAFDPAEKRLAVEVEDHPLEYAEFEGQIPAGQYGAGEVIVWDRGNWQPLGDPHESLQKGKLEFELQGEKLVGQWVLVRLHGREHSRKHNWLLIKRNDKHAQPLNQYDVLDEKPLSVKTGRSLQDIANGNRPIAHPKKQTSKGVQTRRKLAQQKKVNHSAKRSPLAYRSLPESIDVELATLADQVPEGAQWLHEIKFDGYRLICRIENSQVKLLTRRQQDWTHRYPTIAAEASKLPVDSAILDGELVALLPSGLSNFQALHNSSQAGATKLAYYLFDLLYLNGEDLRGQSLENRKSRLQALLRRVNADVLRYSDHIEADGAAFFRESCQMGLEGIICKRRDRPYIAGRGRDWLKVKCLGREELVIGGFTLSSADRRGIGALLVGYFDGQKLIYAGRVGTGFSSRVLLETRQRLENLRQKACPFESVPAKERSAQVKWVQPKLVAEIQFAEWTAGGVLRQPSFQGWREDKSAEQVQRPASLSLMGKEDKMTTAYKPGSANQVKAPSVRAPSQSQLSRQLPLKLTHPDRVLYPDTGLTKLGLANFYAEIAEWILPHLVDRPLSLVRCPQGQAAGKCFFQKHAGPGTREVLGQVPIEESDGTTNYVYVRDLAGLLSLVQMNVLEIHPWGSKRDRVDYPDRLTFDLDPGPNVSWPQVIDAAMLTRELLRKHDLESFLKTTGGKGLHVVVPIAPRRRGWPQAKQFCKYLAGLLAERQPRLYTISMAKAARQGRIFIDYLRNDRGSTAIAAFSTRARPGAPVSTPLRWDELTNAIRSDHFNVANLPARLRMLKRVPWAKMESLKQAIPAIRKK